MLEKLQGKKTYALVIGAVLFNVLAKTGWLPEGMTEEGFVDFVNVLFGFGAIATTRAGITKVKDPAPPAAK